MNNCITQQYVLDPHHPNCPANVKEDIMELGRRHEFGNDSFYDYDEEWDAFWADENLHPALRSFLKSQNVKKCMIKIWW